MNDSGTDKIDLLIVDDHVMFREGLARSLERDFGLNVVGQCGTSAEALAILRQNSRVSIVLLDMDLRSERGTAFIQAARQAGFQTPVLVLTAGVSDLEAVQLIRNGVAGIFHKEHSTEALCGAIRRVVGGEPLLETDYLQSVFRAVAQTEDALRPGLTSRDRTLLRFILEGLTSKAIGQRLEVSEGTVKASLRQLFDKLGVRTRAQLVKVALENYRDEL
jgi:two-component system, NarL family, nitrate/nitrite response regulator NarL